MLLHALEAVGSPTSLLLVLTHSVEELGRQNFIAFGLQMGCLFLVLSVLPSGLVVYKLNMVIILIIIYRNVITAMYKIHTLLHFNNSTTEVEGKRRHVVLRVSQ